ncbi:MAG: Bcr/CflA family multidrug efflux MFS transporter [Rickettsiales bacterium]|nr:MAG: Bcr/CflA family multidrug efflux MFS transporter [Rickettsiales bacterium]
MKQIGQIPQSLLYCLISLSVLTEAIYSVALPNIAEQLNTDGGIAQLSTTAYHLGFTVGIFTLGRCSDIYGRRPVILFGISFYIIATYLITLSSNIETFIAFRFLQAYGASVGSVVAQAMARDSYKGWELTYIYASVALVMSIVPSFGSAVGGYIVEYSEEWEDVFRFLIVVSSILLLIYAKFLPETNAYIGSGRSNRFSAVLRVALRDKLLLSSAFIVGAYNGIMFSFYIQMPFIFIERMKMPPSEYGQLFLALTVANMAGGLFSRYLVKRFVSNSRMKIMGLTFSCIACLGLLGSTLWISETSSITFTAMMIFMPMSIHLMGHALIVPMMLKNALKDYYKVVGTAGAIFGALYYLVTALVSLMISLLHSNTINNYAYIYATLMVMCIGLLFMTFKWQNNATEPTFN